MSEFQQVVKDGADKAGSILKKGVLLLLLLAAIGTGLYIWGSNWTYSDGTRAGTLIKLSRKGVVWKTYEGQLNLGGFQESGDEGIVGNIWNFSVPKKKFYQKLQEYEGQRVRLHYREVFNAMPWQGKTEYFVYEVELVGKKE